MRPKEEQVDKSQHEAWLRQGQPLYQAILHKGRRPDSDTTSEAAEATGQRYGSGALLP